MTTTHIYADGTVQPELPPLPIGALVAGTAELLQHAADLPQPCYTAISDTQSVDFLFASEQASIGAVLRWAKRFGSTMTSQPHEGKNGPETWYRTDFDYYGIAVSAYVHIPAAPANN
jgi:hypothetical protein